MTQIRSETKQFSFDELQPGKTYRAVVRAFNAENKRIGRSANIEFKTNKKDTAPPPVTNLSGAYDTNSLNLSWEYEEFPADFSGFSVTISNQDNSLSTTLDNGRNTTFNLDYIQIITLFVTPPLELNISVTARDNSGNQSVPVTLNLQAVSLQDPENVKLEAAIAGYTVSWDEVSQTSYNYTRIYESNSLEGDYAVSYTSATTPVFVPSTNYTPRYVKVSHVNSGGIETNLVASVPTNVTPININVVDTTPPDQRESIVFTAGVGSVTATWSNPTDENNNNDIAGVSIRYAKTSSPSNYNWITVPFSYNEPLTSASIQNLLPNTSYDFYLATFDKSQNYTEYSISQSVVTLSDSTPPPQPIAPSVAGGTTAGGPFIIRITQQSIENGTTTPLPLDTSYFKIFMLNSGNSSSPTAGVIEDDNAVEIGTLVAAFNGGESQSNFYVPLAEGEQRYFYTRAVDTSNNVSDASPAIQSSQMTVIDNAYISDLSADKITAGRLNANEYIQVGTSSEQITIKSTSTLGQIYSGSGTYGSSGLYLDTSGKFSLKDRLIFDGTNLFISGGINATSGSFTGPVGISIGGSLYIGSNPNSGARIVLNNTSIGGYSNQVGNPQTFLLTTSGTSTISGWSITPSSIEKTAGIFPNTYTIKLDSANSRITAGTGNSTAGIKASVIGGVSIWAGSDTGTTSSPFYVTNSGFLKATNAQITGLITGSQGIFTGKLAVPGTSLNLVGGGAHVPTLTIDSGSGNNQSSYLAMIRRVGEDNDAALEFYVEQSNGNAVRRGRLSHDGGAGGKLVLSAYPSSTGQTDSVIDLKADEVLINGLPITSGGGGTGSGTVTSVALTAPTGFSVSGSPITTSGTLAISLGSTSSFQVLRSGSSGAVAWAKITGDHINSNSILDVSQVKASSGLFHDGAGTQVESWYGTRVSASAIPSSSTYPDNTLLVVI